jgi:dienelactone hydrolase
MRKLVLSMLAVVGAALLLAALLWFRVHGAVVEPTGRYGIGTRTVVWTSPETGRSIPVAFAYPAADAPAGAVIARGAPQQARKHPLVVFAPDVGSSTSLYRSLAYELASNGFVVAVVGSPGIERLSRFPDRIERWDDAGRAAGAVRDANGWSRAASDERYRAAAQVSAGDITLTLDQINEEAHARLDPLFISVRVGDVAFAGHGLGGTAALLACRGDSRCDAAATIAGPPPDATPFTKPLLAVATADEPTGLDALVAQALGPTYGAVIDRSARLDVTDIGRILPRPFLPAGSTVHPGHGTRAARDVLLAFCMRHLMQFPVPMLDKPDVLEGVTLTSRAPMATSER